jgi:DNA primase
MDVMGLFQAGFENAVSPMGTALSENQLRLLKRYSRNVVLALDPDAAGSRATLRGLDIARETFDRDVDPVFDARGLLRHEKRLDAELRVITLPEGKDPDEVVAEDPSLWSSLIDSAQPIVDYVIGVLSKDQDLDDAKTKADIARQVLPLIEDIADSVEREAYRQHLARKLHVDERALLSSRPATGSRRSSRRMGDSQEVEQLPSRGKDIPLERFCLGLLLQDPELLYRINRQFQALQMNRLTQGDFSGIVHRSLFEAVNKALNQDEEEPSNYWRSKLDESLIEVADQILADLSNLTRFARLELERPKVADEVAARFLQLRKQNLENELNRLQFLLREAVGMDVDDSEADIDIGSYTNEVQQYAVQKAKLEQALARRQGSLLGTT